MLRTLLGTLRTWPRGLALLVGGLPALTFPEPSLWWLAYVALVPLILVIRAAPTAREAAIRGWFGGAGFIIAVHHWLLPNVHVFLAVVAVAVGALWAPWGWLTWRVLHEPLSARRLVAALVLVPCGWVVIELIRSIEYLGGPWGLMGASQWQVRPALVLAGLGGVWLVSLVVVALNVAIAAAVAIPTARTAAAVSATVLVVGVLAWWVVAPGPAQIGTVRIAVVQAGALDDPGTRFDRGETLTQGLVGEQLDLVVWGESSVGFDLTSRPDLRDRLAADAGELGAPILVNVDARRRDRPGISKSSVLVTADGSADQRYDKTRLVPFGEYIPLRWALGWVSGVTEAARVDRIRGDGLVLLDLDGLQLGTLVCFESAFPDMSRHLAQRGADLLVFQSSTATFQQSWAPEQHASIAAIRAAETWRPVVHATLTGVSALYDGRGRLLGSIGPSERSAQVFEIPLTSGRSPYTRFGDWVLVLAVSTLVAAAISRAHIRVDHGRFLDQQGFDHENAHDQRGGWRGVGRSLRNRDPRD